MSINRIEVEKCFEANGFVRMSSTKKVIEYESRSNDRVIYLRLEQGFRNYINLIVHPYLDTLALVGIEGVEVNPRKSLRHSSNMKRFPKRLHGGKDPIPYGQSLHVHSGHALAEVCKTFHTI
jgi:hypothetical protein